MASIARAFALVLLACGPAAAQTAAPPTLKAEAQALLRRGIPVGLVLGPRASLDAPPDGLDAVDDSGVVLVRVRDAACAPHVERVLDTTDIEGPPSAVVFRFAARLDPTLDVLPPPGVVGGGPSGDPEDARRLFATPVALDGGTLPLRAALNEVATKAGRIGWFIAADREPDGRVACRLGLLTPTTTLFAFHAIPPP